MIDAAATKSDIPTELIKRFGEDCAVRGLSPETTRRYLSSIKIFNNFLLERDFDILNVDKDVLKTFLEYLRKDRNITQKTVENYFAALTSFYDFLEYEDYVLKNPINTVRKRYLRRYKDNNEGQMRRLISIDEMTNLINSTIDIRDKAIITLLAKTGILRRELITLDADDIDLVEQIIRLKPTLKRTNRTIFFDDETALLLHRWIRVRESRNEKGTKALFINEKGGRLNRNGVYTVVTKAAEKVGLHNPASDRIEDHFSPHCCRLLVHHSFKASWHAS